MSSPGEPKFKPLFEDDAAASSEAVVTSIPPVELDAAAPEAPIAFESIDLGLTEDAPPPAESSFAPPTEPFVEAPIAPPFAETQTSETPTFNTTSSDAEPPAPSAQAEFPFHVRIEGPLTEHEKAKLVSLLDGDDFGVRSIDIEPQIDSGSVLLPRMSRYATAYLLQNLPLTQASVKVQLIEEAFAPEAPIARVRSIKEEIHHPADDLPVTQAEAFPQFPGAEVFDFISYSLTSPAGDTAEPFERLKRKLRFVAHGRGAQGITRFRQAMAPTLDPAFTRLTVSGDLIRKR